MKCCFYVSIKIPIITNHGSSAQIAVLSRNQDENKNEVCDEMKDVIAAIITLDNRFCDNLHVIRNFTKEKGESDTLCCMSHIK